MASLDISVEQITIESAQRYNITKYLGYSSVCFRSSVALPRAVSTVSSLYRIINQLLVIVRKILTSILIKFNTYCKAKVSLHHSALAMLPDPFSRPHKEKTGKSGLATRD